MLNQKFFETKINNDTFKLLVIFSIQFFFYIVTPNIINFFDINFSNQIMKSFMVHSQTPLLYQQFFDENYVWLQYGRVSILFLFYNVIFYFLLFKFFNLFIDKFNRNNLDINTKPVILIFFVISAFFLAKDNLILLDNLLNGNFERTFIYEKFLSGRTTHLNVCIILSVLNFKLNRKIAYLGYFLIVSYSFLSLSRVPMFYLFLLHVIINLDLTKKKTKTIIIIFIFLLFIVLYRLLFSLDQFNFVNLTTDFLALHINSYVFYENFIQNYKVDQSFTIYLKENYNFMINNFFYSDVKIFNFYETKYFRALSVRGSDSVLSHFLCFFTLICLYYFLLILDKNKNNYLFIVLISYLSIIAFRGNFVHNLAFVVKFHILIIVSTWIVKILKLLKSKVV